VPHRICPWWLGYFLASPIRHWFGCDPSTLLAPYIREGMTVFEPGPGMGYFTLELARRVGIGGRVIAVDVQPRMLAGLKRRAAKAGVLDRIDARLVSAESMNLTDLIGRVDFTLAFAMVHELPSAIQFFMEAFQLSKQGASLLLAEPTGHVKDEAFEAELQNAMQVGFAVAERPNIRRSHAALLTRSQL
jgi:cyclopropane fatty-acyl-phospholipid synthase-like methyltransferase